MKLASLRTGERDGALLVVSKDLSSGVLVPAIAKTMQKAIENWAAVEPQLNMPWLVLTCRKRRLMEGAVENLRIECFLFEI